MSDSTPWKYEDFKAAALSRRKELENVEVMDFPVAAAGTVHLDWPGERREAAIYVYSLQRPSEVLDSLNTTGRILQIDGATITAAIRRFLDIEIEAWATSDMANGNSAVIHQSYLLSPNSVYDLLNRTLPVARSPNANLNAALLYPICPFESDKLFFRETVLPSGSIYTVIGLKLYDTPDSHDYNYAIVVFEGQKISTFHEISIRADLVEDEYLSFDAHQETTAEENPLTEEHTNEISRGKFLVTVHTQVSPEEDRQKNANSLDGGASR